MSASEFEATGCNRVRQAAKRGHYDRATVFEILDANLIGNVGFITADGPCIIPMLFGRRDDELLFHGSSKSRLMSVLCSGEPVCVSTTTLDGLVLAKSAFHHSMNYRSATVFGTGFEVTDEDQRMAALKNITDKTMMGRWEDARQPNLQEMKATCIAAVRIESASAKIRTGPPNDDPEDMSLPVWTGVIPLSQVAGEPINRPDETLDLEVPEYVHQWRNRRIN
jgi:nitroimidazol reductase NimA-like FMN-containing flavoprotein (pyridoxamine 5'-phosphate oxidase superfamily)